MLAAGVLRSRRRGLWRCGDGIASQTSSITLPLISISSGGSGFYGIVYAVIYALFLFHLYKRLGYEVEPAWVKSDSNAGRGAVARFGVGKRMRNA